MRQFSNTKAMQEELEDRSKSPMLNLQKMALDVYWNIQDLVDEIDFLSKKEFYEKCTARKSKKKRKKK